MAINTHYDPCDRLKALARTKRVFVHIDGKKRQRGEASIFLKARGLTIGEFYDEAEAIAFLTGCNTQEVQQ